MNAQHIASRLTHNQKQVVRDLNISEPTVLGCIETVAFGLCRERNTRPALVEHRGDGSFVLTAAGSQVKAYL